MDTDQPLPSDHPGQTFEADSAAYALAVTTFVSWAEAGGGQARATFTPDTLIVVNNSNRRGWLLDEIYFVTIWANIGTAQLRADFDHAFTTAGQEVMRPTQSERAPLDLLKFGLRSSRPVSDVQHLL